MDIPVSYTIQHSRKIARGAVSWWENSGTETGFLSGKKSGNIIAVRVPWICTIDWNSPAKFIDGELILNTEKIADNSVRIIYTSRPPCGKAENEHWQSVVFSWPQ